MSLIIEDLINQTQSDSGGGGTPVDAYTKEEADARFANLRKGNIFSVSNTFQGGLESHSAIVVLNNGFRSKTGNTYPAELLPTHIKAPEGQFNFVSLAELIPTADEQATTKYYVDNQLVPLETEIASNQSNITTLQNDIGDLGDQVQTLQGKVNQLNVPTSLSVTLTAEGWDSETKTITVTATGVTTSNIVLLSAAPDSAETYSESFIVCTAQAADSLTFKATTVPTVDVVVNVVIL